MRTNSRSHKLIPVKTPRFNRKHRPFVDKLRVLLSSGRGGDGASIMDAQKNMEFGGPIGGNGGQGGSVFMRSSHLYPDLFHIKSMGTSISAGAGRKGMDMLSFGSNGRHLVLDVPLGTVLRDADSNVEICDLSAKLDEMVMVLEGGIGGKGNAAFKSSVCVSPVSATNGLPGNSIYASIELKTLADVSLVGLPNAGKSSVLGAISSCRPEVAAYPFTTLNPSVGKLYSFIGDQTCDIADLPGLVEGAYENRGLGHQFLQHIERSKLICLVIDMNESYYSYDYELQQKELVRSDHRTDYENNNSKNVKAFDAKDVITATTYPDSIAPSPCEVIDQLVQELYFYDSTLPSRIAAVFCNKMDVKHDVNGVPLAKKFLDVKNHVRRKLGKNVECFPVSAEIALNAGNAESMMRQEAEDNYHAMNNNNKNQKNLPPLSYNDQMRMSGLPAAVEYLTKRVFALKKTEKDERDRRDEIRNMADQELYSEKNRLLLEDPLEFTKDENNGNHSINSIREDEEYLMTDEELIEKDRREQEIKQKEARDRLLQLKGSKRRDRGFSGSLKQSEREDDDYFCMMNSKVKKNNSGTSSSSTTHDRRQHFQGDSHQPATNFTSSKRDFFGKHYSSSSSSSSQSLFDDQFGDFGVADTNGAMRSTYGGEYSNRVSEMAALDADANGKFRINTERDTIRRSKNSTFAGHSKMPESNLRATQRATYGKGFGEEED